MSLLQSAYYHVFDLEATRAFTRCGNDAQAITDNADSQHTHGYRIEMPLGGDTPPLILSWACRQLMYSPGVMFAPNVAFMDDHCMLANCFDGLYGRPVSSDVGFSARLGFHFYRSDRNQHELVIGHPKDATHALISVGWKTPPADAARRAFAASHDCLLLGVVDFDNEESLQGIGVHSPQEYDGEDHWLVPVDFLGDQLNHYLDAVQNAYDAQTYANWQTYGIQEPFYRDQMQSLLPALRGAGYRVEDLGEYFDFYPITPAGPTVSLWFQEDDYNLLVDALRYLKHPELLSLSCAMHTAARVIKSPA